MGAGVKEVSSIHELKVAMGSDAAEIITHQRDLVKKLKAVKRVKSWGPVAAGGVIAAVPLVITTGPFGAMAISGFVSSSGGVAVSTIVALIVAVGGTIAISLFSDWDYVEINGRGIKMRRKGV